MKYIITCVTYLFILLLLCLWMVLAPSEYQYIDKHYHEVCCNPHRAYYAYGLYDSGFISFGQITIAWLAIGVFAYVSSAIYIVYKLKQL